MIPTEGPIDDAKLAMSIDLGRGSPRTSPPATGRPELPSSFEQNHGSATQPTEFLDEKLCSVPQLASREVRVLLTNLQNRQEQLFERVLDQQKVFHVQLAAIQSAIKDKSNAQHMFKRQENFMAEFDDFSSKLPRTDVDGKVVQTKSDAALPADLVGPPAKPSAAVTSEAEANHKPKLDILVVTSQGEANHKPKLDTLALTSEDDAKRKAKLDTLAEQLSNHHSDSALRTELRKTLGQKEGIEDDDTKGFGRRVSAMLTSKKFEMGMAVAILINAFIMCWESQYQGLDVGFDLKYPGRPVEAHIVWVGAETVFSCFDWFFGCLFLAEMIIKLLCWRQAYFWKLPEESSVHNIDIKGGVRSSSNDMGWKLPCSHFWYGVQAWNLLDGIVVVAFLFDKVAAAGFVNPQMLRLLRLFRLGRLIRLLRFLETLDHLYVMTTAISGLKQILAWAIVLLTLMLLTCDLFLVQILHVTYFDQVKASDLSPEQLKKYREVYEYFGTCTRCMLSMFEMTLGNWPPIARLLSEEVSEWFTLVCLAHKLTIGFAVVGVVTGCILQETFKVAQTDDEIMFRQKNMSGRIFARKMAALFEALDVSQDGVLEVEEFEAIGAIPKIKTWLSSLNIETGDLRTLFDLIDVDGDGHITIDELVARMPRIQGNARSIDVLALQKQLFKKLKKSDGGKEGANRASSFADFLLE